MSGDPDRPDDWLNCRSDQSRKFKCKIKIVTKIVLKIRKLPQQRKFVNFFQIYFLMFA